MGEPPPVFVGGENRRAANAFSRDDGEFDAKAQRRKGRKEKGNGAR